MAVSSNQIVRHINVSAMTRGLPIMFNALPGIVGTPGPAGPPGPGSYTQLVNPFTMPNPGTSVNVTVGNTSWMVGGASIYIAGAGYFTVQSVFDATHATLINVNAPGNVASGTVVSAPQGISSAGAQGAQGIQGVIGPIGPQGAVGPQGTGVTYRGTWSGSTNYSVNDSVSYGGSSYVALKTSVGVVPGTDPTTWGVFAAQGQTGATGAPGVQGPPGQNGATGAPGPASTSITQAQYTQPAVNANVTVSVNQTAWCPAGSVVFIAGGGYYEVTSVPDATHLVLTNPGWQNAATPGSTVASGALVSAGGVAGAPGAPGGTGPVGPQGIPGTAGARAYSILQTAFTVPAPGSQVSLTVDSTAWMVIGLNLYIVGAGYYQVASVGGANLIAVTNLGYTGNALPGTSIASGALMYAGGAPQTVNRDYYYTDFDNGWSDWVITSGTVAAKGTQVDPDSQGIVVLNCAAASASTYGLQSGTGAAANQIGNRTTYFHTKVQIPQLSTATDSFGFYFGWLDNVPTAAFQNGVFFYYTDGGSTPAHWGCYARRAGTQVFTDSGITVATGIWYDLEVTIDAVYATFSIAQYATNATPTAPVIVAQIAISQCPAAGQGLGAVFGGSKLAGSSVAPAIWVDMYEHEVLYKGTPKFRQPAIAGPPGKNSLTGTTATFVTPASGANIAVSVADTSFMAPGMLLYIGGAGTYQVASVNSPTGVTVQNTGATGNAPPSTQVNSGATVAVSGVAGPQGVIGPVGPVGPVGQGASTTLTNSFIQPTVNSTVNVPVVNSSWIAPGAIIYIQSGGYYTVQSVPNLQNLTVVNPGYSGNAAPGATVLNNSQVSPGGVVGPPGVDPAIVGSIMDWCGPGLPQGWLVADGSAQSRTTYPQLYTALGGAASIWGQGDGSTTFNIPDLRGRTLIGVGQGAGLTNRLLGGTGGEEAHALTLAELAAHTHNATASATEADHYHTIPASGNHTHGDQGHTHTDSGHNHTVGMPSAVNLGFGGGAAFYQSASGASSVGHAAITTGYANLAYSGNIGPATTDWASNTGIPGITVSVTLDTQGSGSAHNNMPPWVAIYIIIKAAYNAPVGPTVPLADTTQNGLLRQVSGLITDYVGGDNTCHDLASAVRTYAPVIRSYNSIGNSSFEIDARTVGAGVSATGFALDRWQYAQAGSNRGTAIQTAAPAGVIIAGTAFAISANFLRYTLTTQEGTLGSSDYIMIQQFVEGPRLRELLGGQTAISIVCRSNVANTVFGCFIRDANSAYSLTQLCTLPNANAWTLISLSGIANWTASGSFPITPGSLGYTFGICLAAGTTLTAASNNVWAAGNFIGAKTQGNFAANSVNSTFDLAYIGHEPGATPNGVIDLDYQTNQQRCFRYYQKGTAPGSPPVNGNYKQIGFATTATTARLGVVFRPKMAKTPTVRLCGNTSTTGQVYVDGTGNVAIGSVTLDSAGLQDGVLGTSVSGWLLLGDWDADTGW